MISAKENKNKIFKLKQKGNNYYKEIYLTFQKER